MNDVRLDVSFDAIEKGNAVVEDTAGATGMPELAASCDPNDAHPNSCDGPGLVIEPDIPDDGDGPH